VSTLVVRLNPHLSFFISAKYIKQMSTGSGAMRKNISLDEIFVYRDMSDCEDSNFQFAVRIGIVKMNKNPDAGTECPEFDQDDKLSAWTDWHGMSRSAVSHPSFAVCHESKRQVEPTKKPVNSEKDPDEEELEESSCLITTSLADFCLKIYHLVIIIASLVLILIGTCIGFCCYCNRNRRESDSASSQASRSENYIPLRKIDVSLKFLFH
jgi:hypothetical protein